MKNLSDLISNFINEDLTLINPKIRGAMLLEILKYKLLDKFKINNLNISEEINEEIIEEISLNNSNPNLNLTANILNYNSNKTSIRTKIEANILLICIKGGLTLDFKDNKTLKNFNYNCIPMTGIVMPASSNFSIINQKNSVILEISLIDEISNIEKNE